MANKALTIQDILERVFIFADEKSLASCAIVSKQWLHLASRTLWASLDTQRPLLKLLAPIKPLGRSRYPSSVRFSTLLYEISNG